MRVLVVGQLSSPHLQRYCDWLYDNNIDVFPMGSADVDSIKYMIDLFKPDIVHAMFVPIWGTAVYQTGFHPYVLTALGSDLLRPEGFLDMLKGEQLSDVVSHAHEIFALSNELRDKAIEFGADPARVHYLHLGIDPEIFREGYSPLWNRFHKNAGTKVILSCRHMHRLYNHETIVRALPAVVSELGDVSLVHIDPNGDPDYYGEIADLIDEVGMTDHVFSQKALPYTQMPWAFNACDVAIGIPSTDGLPLTMLEALSCRKPYIGTDTCENRNFLPKKWLIEDVHDPDEVAKKLIMALKHRYSEDELDAGRSMVETNFNQDILMKRAVSIYRRLI